MLPFLIIGLVWLSVTAALCLLIGRAIRNADRHEEQLSREAWSRRPEYARPRPVSDRRGQVTILAPLPDELLRRPGIARAGGRSPMTFGRQVPDAAADPRGPDTPPSAV